VSEVLILFLIVLALIAVLLRADFVLTVIYLLLGILLIGRWWSSRTLKAIEVQRIFTPHAFLGEIIRVHLQLNNRSLLPVVWLQINESLPVQLKLGGTLRRVVRLGSKDKMTLEYSLEGRRRGYYEIGPLFLYTGDLFGLADTQQRRMNASYLTVYPKIIPLTRVALPSRSPMGDLRHTQPVFEDPSRVIGKRDYVTGDSLRRVDWKATASTGRLQVKLFEPSIALETVIFLDLDARSYEYRTRIDATELAIVVAASLANWITAARQSIGLATNGLDPLIDAESPKPIPPRRGRAHLMRVLEVLARIQSSDSEPIIDLLQREIVGLPWGTTVIVITPRLDEALFDRLFQASRAGLSAVLVPCGPVPHLMEARQRANYFAFPLYHILSERDLDQWRN
jgi:uncharacterized protein (DUF58 family)